ncbi:MULTISPECIES: VOC family protein [Rhizobium]|uniref:VOC family protein n=1 Tax=Rhizobium TaxID=379 RepID=UPI00195755BE|nr:MULTISPECIES: VOC family protein [Rhizobium]MBM7045867.1 VOC family protein [Rhizobium lusitanum]
MKIRQHLWFRRDMEAAIALYTSLIPGSSIGWVSNILNGDPNGPAGSVKFAGFTLGNRAFMGFEAGLLDFSDHDSSITIECETQAEADRLRDALSKGRSTERCSQVRDPWGVSWHFMIKQKVDHIDAPAKSEHDRSTDRAKTKFAIA